MKREIGQIVNYKRENFLLLDFCNIKDLTHNAIFELHKKHKIIHTQYGKNQGYEDSCFSKKDPQKRMWFLIESREAISFRNDRLGISSVLPSEKNGKEIIGFLQKSQIEYKKFLDQCVEGQLNLEFIDKIIAEFGTIGLRLNKSIDDEWTPSVVHGIEYLSTFEAYIDWEILEIIFHHAGSVFERVQSCNWQKCGKFFLHKRKDQKYCSSNCSGNKRSNDYRKTRKHADYMKKHSIKGVYISVKNR